MNGIEICKMGERRASRREKWKMIEGQGLGKQREMETGDWKIGGWEKERKKVIEKQKELGKKGSWENDGKEGLRRGD